ncbi:MAG TPA: hypothetical protein VFX20_05765 [Steroidobacteraceae bacterium]|nr:hypothetical protein [Steroidobacteraceae bacterium]
MGIGRRIGIAVVTAALAGGSVAGHAGDPPPKAKDVPVDPGLLEFLGSGDPSSDSSDDAGWLAYLTQTNIGKVSKASQTPQASAQPKPASPPAGAEKPSG